MIANTVQSANRKMLGRWRRKVRQLTAATSLAAFFAAFPHGRRVLMRGVARVMTGCGMMWRQKTSCPRKNDSAFFILYADAANIHLIDFAVHPHYSAKTMRQK